MSVFATLMALLAGAVAELWTPPPRRRWPLLTLGMALLVTGAFALQTAKPDMLPLLARDPRMLSSGELWRAVTALFVQDGGTRGLLFNVFWLLVLGTIAERRFSRPAWLAAYLLGGIVTEFVAVFWQPHGAGNSVACLALAGALCSDWRKGRYRWWRAGVGLTGVVAAFVLFMDGDVHGVAFFVGLVIGFAILAASEAARMRGDDAGYDRSNVVPFIDRGDTLH